MEINIFALTLFFLSISLFVGKLLRMKIKILQKLFLPSSVIGGLILLLVSPQALNLPFLREITEMWEVMAVLPAYLINFIFASLFIGKDIPSLSSIWKLAGPQVCFGQTLAWGQYIIGILLAIFVLSPWLGLPPIAGALIEIGFEGGHGTAAGLGPTFEALGWAEGQDLALGLATIGILVGVVIGIIMVNLATKKGIIKPQAGELEKMQEEDSCTEFEDREPEEKKALVESIEPLSLHLALIGAGIGVGYIILQGLIGLETLILIPFNVEGIMEFVPLFPLAMIGGIIVQIVYRKIFSGKLTIDRNQINRLQGVSLDFLILASLGSLSLQVIADYWEGLFLLAVSGIIWNVLGFAIFAPRFIKNYWFPRGIGDFGQSMGMTATGLLLIRLADPQNESEAISAFGYKQLMFEPVVGGGLFTAASMPLIARVGSENILILVSGLFLFWLILGLRVRKRI